MSSDRSRGTGHRRFHLNRMKAFSAVTMIKLWHDFPRENVNSPSLELFKTHRDSCPSSPVSSMDPVQAVTHNSFQTLLCPFSAYGDDCPDSLVPYFLFSS